MPSDVFTADLGAITAYADAKEHGYTGTREEFGALLANAGANLQQAENAKTAAANSAAAAKKSADDAAVAATAAAQSVGAVYYGVDYTASGRVSAGVRTGAAKDFTFVPGTDTNAGTNSFDAVYPWKGMRRCCCELNSDGTVTVNAYENQPGYAEDGSNGEVLVEIPLFYVSGMLDVNPMVSTMPLPGFRLPKKLTNKDGSPKDRCYIRAFPGSIGSDGKLHSIANALPSMSRNIQQNLAAARLWGEKYSIGTSEDAEVLLYLMSVVYGTRHFQSKINGCVSLYATNLAVAAGLTNEAAVVCNKGTFEPGMVLSIGTGSENESVASRRIVTEVQEIAGDSAHEKVLFTGDAVTTTTDHKIWRILQATGSANSVISSCGSPVSNSDGRHSFVFYGLENPLYGNQWRFECDWKLIDGVPYICNDGQYQWNNADNYTKLDTLVLPNEGWAKNLQADDRFPHLQITKEVGGDSGSYLADYFYINKSGTRVVLRGASSSYGGTAGPWYLDLDSDAGHAWWSNVADLSIPG